MKDDTARQYDSGSDDGDEAPMAFPSSGDVGAADDAFVDGPMELARELVDEPLVLDASMSRAERVERIKDAFDTIDQIIEKEAFESGKKTFTDPGFDQGGCTTFRVWKADKFGFNKERTIELNTHEATMSVLKDDDLHKTHKITFVKCAEPLTPTECKVVFGCPVEATIEEMEEAKKQRPYDLTFEDPSEMDRFIIALAVTQDVGRRREARGKDARKSTIGRRVSLSETNLNCVRLTFLIVKRNKWGSEQERLIDIKPETNTFTVSELTGEVKKVFKTGEVRKVEIDRSDDRKCVIIFQPPANLSLMEQLGWEVNRPYDLTFLNERSRTDFVHSMALARAKWRRDAVSGVNSVREVILRKAQLRTWYVGLLHPAGSIVACELLWQKGVGLNAMADVGEDSLAVAEDTVRLRNADPEVCGFEYGSKGDDHDEARMKINTKFPAKRLGSITYGSFSLGGIKGESLKLHLVGGARETVLTFIFEDQDATDSFVFHARQALKRVGIKVKIADRPSAAEATRRASQMESSLNALTQAVEELKIEQEEEEFARQQAKWK
jgi:hypothetical protein